MANFTESIVEDATLRGTLRPKLRSANCLFGLSYKLLINNSLYAKY